MWTTSAELTPVTADTMSISRFAVHRWSSLLHPGVQGSAPQDCQHGCADHVGHHHILRVLPGCGHRCHGAPTVGQSHDLLRYSPHATGLRVSGTLARAHCQGSNANSSKV